MNPITDDDLILLYYGEHDDPELGRRVAQDAELSARMRRLSDELAVLDSLPTPDPGADFGARTWQRVGPRLTAEASPPARRSWLEGLLQPRFSLAGLFALVLVAGIAFWLGRQVPVPDRYATSPTIDSERLLASRIGDHLSEADVLLTQYANAPDQSEAEWAAGMVVSNRLYRRAAEAAGHDRLARLLNEMEPLLIELANESAHAEPDDSLLFRIRTMNQEITDDRPI